MDTETFSLLDLGCLTDRQSSECLKQRVNQALRILTPCPETDGARAGLALSVIPPALD